ncbi:MAG: restriction endonuclease subunit S, partial [Chitinophagaceae bacterium]|nr:restriction endonuclease subunit S [Chitinophagaceae bacterium]
LNTPDAKAFCQKVKTDGINQSNINAKILATFQIPLPPLETQHQIVTQIEKEQALVNASKQLIAIYGQKIKDRIAKVWGADKKEGVVYEENDMVTMAAEE